MIDVNVAKTVQSAYLANNLFRRRRGSTSRTYPLISLMTSTTIHHYPLTQGELYLETTSKDISHLLDVAARDNVKRGFLFVSKVLGRHIPVAPLVMRQTMNELASKLPNIDDAVVFIGLAETAVGLGAGVFSAFTRQNPLADAVYLTTTRHELSTNPILCEFKEPHSHAAEHLLHYPADPEVIAVLGHAKTLVLIDDEITTGTTLLNLVHAVMQSGHFNQIEQVYLLSLTDWSDGSLPLRSPLPLQSLSLVQGHWTWSPFEGVTLPALEHTPLEPAETSSLSASQSWGRLGSLDIGPVLKTNTPIEASDRVLVLGSNEFVYQPFLFAEQLEQNGICVEFSAITRSPIRPGGVIESMASFNDVYGEGIRNFVYNISHRRFEKIFLCVEVPSDSVCEGLLTHLHQISPFVEVISND